MGTSTTSQTCSKLSNPESRFYQHYMQAVLGEEVWSGMRQYLGGESAGLDGILLPSQHSEAEVKALKF